MARKPRKEQGAVPPPAESGSEAPSPAPSAQTDAVFSARQYLLMNAAFALFCILQLVVVRLALGESQGLYFFFGLLIAGFAAISVFDYVYDRTAGEPSGRSES
jgi:hypothetical protein